MAWLLCRCQENQVQQNLTIPSARENIILTKTSRITEFLNLFPWTFLLFFFWINQTFSQELNAKNCYDILFLGIFYVFLIDYVDVRIFVS